MPALESEFARRGRADVMDIALAGKTAVIEALECDAEDRIQLALVLEDDPGKDLGMMRQPGHRFFYGIDEVEPLKEQDESANSRRGHWAIFSREMTPSALKSFGTWRCSPFRRLSWYRISESAATISPML